MIRNDEEPSVSQDCDPQVPSTIHCYWYTCYLKVITMGFMSLPLRGEELRCSNHKEANENPREEVGNLKTCYIF